MAALNSTFKNVLILMVTALCMVACQKDALEDLETTPVSQITTTKVKKSPGTLSIQEGPVTMRRNNRQIASSRSSSSMELIFQDTGSVALDEYKAIVWIDSMLTYHTCQYTIRLTPTSGDPDLYLLGHNGTDYRTFAGSELEAQEVEELSVSKDDLIEGETGVVAVYGYEAASYKIEVFENCSETMEEEIVEEEIVEEPTPPTHKQLNYLKRVYKYNYYLEYSYDELGRVVKEKRINEEREVPSYSVWSYDGTSKNVQAIHNYSVQKDNTPQLNRIEKYEYNSNGQLIKKIDYRVDKDFNFKEISYEYDINNSCSYIRQTKEYHDGETETIDYSYLNENCSYIATWTDGEEEYKTEVLFDGFNNPYESLNNQPMKHNIKKVIDLEDNEVEEFMYQYNEDGYPISELESWGETTYEYDITIPSPSDTTVVVPFLVYQEIDSKEVATKVLNKVKNVINEIENNLAYRTTSGPNYNITVDGDVTGIIAVNGGKTKTETENNSPSQLNSTVTTRIDLDYDADKFSNSENFIIHDGAISYYEYKYVRSKMNINGGGFASSKEYEKKISASNLIVSYTDETGKTYTDEITITISQESDYVPFIQVTSSSGRSFIL